MAAAAPSFVSGGKHLKDGEPFPRTKPGVLRIYSMQFCPFAQRTRLVASHKNIPHEIVNYSLIDKPDWLVEKNPLGKAPTVELDGKVVYDSLITCDYLDELFPENPLHPKDPFQKAHERMLVEKLCSKLFAYYPVLFDQSPDHVEAKKKEITQGLESLTENLHGTFLGGSSPTMVDFMVYPVMEKLIASSLRTAKVLENTVDLQKYPKVAAWVQAMQETPANKATYIPVEKVALFFDGYSQNKPNYDL